MLRDEARQRSTVIWQGKTAVSYPWGRFDHSEKLTYDVDDAHPDVARVQGDSQYIQALQDHVLTWRGRLDVSSDAQTFFYKYTRTLLKDGTVIRTGPGRNRFRGTTSERGFAAAPDARASWVTRSRHFNMGFRSSTVSCRRTLAFDLASQAHFARRC